VKIQSFFASYYGHATPTYMTAMNGSLFYVCI